MNMGGVAASQTGTFTASSGTGTVVVDGVTFGQRRYRRDRRHDNY